MSVYDELTESQQFASRVIADHARSTAFAIADGILPGNEGRNYVLRKIMRRAIYHGREHLGLTDPFFYKVCDFVVTEMNGAYPELETQRDFISKMVRIEEERFGNTVTVGLKKLEEVMQKHLIPVDFDGVDDIEAGTIPLDELGKLYDTYGTPIDLIYVILSNDKRGKLESSRNKKWVTHDRFSNYSFAVADVSEQEFKENFDTELCRIQTEGNIGKTRQNEKINPIYAVLEKATGRSKFHGYEKTEVEDAEILGLVKDEKQVTELAVGEEGLVLLRDTPFYAEAGGQVGDSGKLTGKGNLTREQKLNVLLDEKPEFPSGFVAKVFDTFSPMAGLILHKAKVEKGILKVGDTVTATVDAEKRDATRRNHTATHLVHSALREVLGTHVKQAGSVVSPSVLRFDFTHYQPMTDAEIAEVEDLVNRHILENHPVNTNVMAIEEAMAGGAMALFGEKYGSAVRVLSVGDGVFSKELCGGTHVRATGDIGSFKITADEAIASGVRRIRAITGFDAFARFREDERLIDASLGALKTQRDNLPNAIERLQEELKKTRKEMDELKLKIALGSSQSSVAGGQSSDDDSMREIAGVKVLAKQVDGLDANGTRQLSDTLLARLKSGVVIIGRSDEGKVGIIVRVSDDLTGKIKAGDIIREIAPIVGGRGGGKADMAEGGGTEAGKLAEAIDAAYVVIERMLG